MLVSEPIVYGVNVKDTLDLSFKYKYNEEDYNEEMMFYRVKNRDSILVFVDTIRSDFHTDEMNYFDVFPPPPPPKELDSTYLYKVNYDTIAIKERIVKRRREHYNTLPVFIFNNSNSDRVISKPIVNGDLFIQVQAKDRNDKWNSIEYNYVPGFICGTGHQDYQIKSKHYIVSTIKKYSGDYKTKLRVKFMSFEKVYYSNEFYGSINYSQFHFPEQVSRMYKRYPDSTNTTHNYKNKLIFLDFD